MAVKELTDSLSEVLRERVKSPLLGSFLLSWVAWNWRALLFLVYNENDFPIAKRVEIVGSLLTVWRSAVWPAVTATALVVILPPLSIAATLLWSWFDKHRKTLDLRIRQITPITPEERRNVILAIQEQEERFDRALQMQELENRKMRQDADQQIEALREESSTLHAEISSLKIALRDCELQRDYCRQRLRDPEPNILELREQARLKVLFESAAEASKGDDASPKR